MNTINRPKINIIFLVLFIGVSIILTFFLIKNKISSLNNEDFVTIIQEKTNKNKATDTYLGIKSLEETYNQNDLSYKTYCYDRKKDYELESEYDDCQGIKYFQFNGLKNETILNNINQEIKEKVHSLTQKSFKCYINGNFSNILSIGFNYYNNSLSKMINLNYDLNTGKEINFLDLFTSDTPINSIIAKSAYENLAWKNAYTNEESFYDSIDMSKIDTGEYEDKILKIINEFQAKKENLNFSITSSNIIIYDIGDTNLTIDYKDCKEYIALFKKYSSNTSLYKSDDIGLKNIFVMTTPFIEINNASPKESIYGFINDNFYADITLYDKINSIDLNNAIEEKITQDVNNKIKTM